MSSAPSTQSFRRGLVPTKLGLVHYTEIGKGQDTSSTMMPIVGFHMSPRSVDEYREIMTNLLSVSAASTSVSPGAGRWFVAMDELGYGCSDSPTKSCTLDEIADCFLEVADHLHMKRFIVAGSLMGSYVALSLAGRYPDRVAGVVCSNLYYFTTQEREKSKLANSSSDDGNTASTTPIADSWILEDDGSHLCKLWASRSDWLSPELNTRACLDNLQYLMKRRERYAKGISIQDGSSFDLEQACSQVHCPVLCITGAAAVQFLDAIGMDMSGQFAQVLKFFPCIPPPTIIVLEGPTGASINMLNENASEWVEHVMAFCQTVESSNTSVI